MSRPFTLIISVVFGILIANVLGTHFFELDSSFVEKLKWGHLEHIVYLFGYMIIPVLVYGVLSPLSDFISTQLLKLNKRNR